MSKTAFFWAILTALIWGIVPVLEKIGLAKINPSAGLLVRCCGVIVGAGILLFFRFNSLKDQLSAITPQALIFLLLGGFLASFVGQLCFYRALKTGSASAVVPIAAAYPLVSFVLALIFLGERFTFLKLLGVSFVLFGITLLN